MKAICPHCEATRDVELVDTKETIEIKGESIEIPVKYYKCLTCGEDFDDPKADSDPLERAYAEYRSRHGMVQPSDLRAFRKKYGLTQNELSKLLGWGPVTLSRYENGALQDEAHDKEVRLAMEPRNLINLIEDTPDAISNEKRLRLLKDLKMEEEEAFSFERIFEERFGKYEADELSGFKHLDVSKIFNAILFFCREGDFKTKVNKLLFYADFRHFKEYTTSITGARYVCLPFGPVPDNYDHYFAALIGNGLLKVEEEVCGPGFVTEKLVTIGTSNVLSLFSDSEIKALLSVKEYFKDYTATKIKDFSHEEQGYKETSERQCISYEYADTLQI
jgi:putative zinc finger/helix-turn-helix YgiT family protein